MLTAAIRIDGDIERHIGAFVPRQNGAARVPEKDRRYPIRQGFFGDHLESLEAIEWVAGGTTAARSLLRTSCHDKSPASILDWIAVLPLPRERSGRVGFSCR
jgi:hypothetical protein